MCSQTRLLSEGSAVLPIPTNGLIIPCGKDMTFTSQMPMDPTWGEWTRELPRASEIKKKDLCIKFYVHQPFFKHFTHPGNLIRTLQPAGGPFLHGQVGTPVPCSPPEHRALPTAKSWFSRHRHGNVSCHLNRLFPVSFPKDNTGDEAVFKFRNKFSNLLMDLRFLPV